MKINNDPTVGIGERLVQEAAVERRSGEKAVTQVTSGEMGVGGEDTRASDKAQRLAIAMDSTRLSSSAMARYRIFAGAKAADEQARQGRGTEIFPEADGIDNPREPQRKSDQRTSSSHMNAPAESRNSGDGQGDPVAQVRERIKEVQQLLTEAQERLAQAAAKVSEAQHTEKPEEFSEKSPADPVAIAPARGRVPVDQAGQTVAQAAMAAAANEVTALAGELLKLYQELMKALQARSGG